MFLLVGTHLCCVTLIFFSWKKYAHFFSLYLHIISFVQTVPCLSLWISFVGLQFFLPFLALFHPLETCTFLLFWTLLFQFALVFFRKCSFFLFLFSLLAMREKNTAAFSKEKHQLFQEVFVSFKSILSVQAYRNIHAEHELSNKLQPFWNMTRGTTNGVYNLRLHLIIIISRVCAFVVGFKW